MRRIPWAGFQLPALATIPAPVLRNLEIVVAEILGDIERAAIGERGMCLLFRGERGDALELLSRHNRQALRHVEQARATVRPFRGVIPLSGHRAPKLYNSRPVEDRLVNSYSFIVEACSEGGKNVLQQCHGRLVVRQVNAVEQVRAVAAVGLHRFWPPFITEPCFNRVGSCLRLYVLRLGRRNASRPNRITVNEEPSPADDISIGRQRVFAPDGLSAVVSSVG
jgi:hypothetical protein